MFFRFKRAEMLHSTPGRQPASLKLVIEANATPVEALAEVVRITPEGIRLNLVEAIGTPLSSLFRWNRQVTISLPLPKPRQPAITQGRVVAVASCDDHHPPCIQLDIEFLEITDEEERMLRDSNPLLVVV